MSPTDDKPVSAAQKTLGDFAPKLVELTDGVLFGDVWERPELSKRDRSLITCAALVATGKTEQMTFHFPRALENGVTREELVERYVAATGRDVTHVPFWHGLGLWKLAIILEGVRRRQQDDPRNLTALGAIPAEAVDQLVHFAHTVLDGSAD